jgi:hypothetical protein
VFLAKHKVDFRKGPDGLLGEAYLLGADPYQGDCVLFVKRDHTHFVDTLEPTPIWTVDHWDLGMSELGDTTLLH